MPEHRLDSVVQNRPLGQSAVDTDAMAAKAAEISGWLESQNPTKPSPEVSTLQPLQKPKRKSPVVTELQPQGSGSTPSKGAWTGLGTQKQLKQIEGEY